MTKSRTNDTTKMLLAGALAGLAATVPMTVAMEAMHRRLPARQRHPLPPRKTAMRAARRARLAHKLDEPQRLGLTLASHFGYGTGAGALYGPLSRRVKGPAVLKGMGYGVGVWAVSYLGLLPVLGLMRPATRHAPQRNALMIAAHLVWGATLGLLTECWTRRAQRAPALPATTRRRAPLRNGRTSVCPGDGVARLPPASCSRDNPPRATGATRAQHRHVRSGTCNVWHRSIG